MEFFCMLALVAILISQYKIESITIITVIRKLRPQKGNSNLDLSQSFCKPFFFHWYALPRLRWFSWRHWCSSMSRPLTLVSALAVLKQIIVFLTQSHFPLPLLYLCGPSLPGQTAGLTLKGASIESIGVPEILFFFPVPGDWIREPRVCYASAYYASALSQQ